MRPAQPISSGRRGPAPSRPGPGDQAGVDRRERLSAARLYLCTDARERQGDLPEFLDAVLAAGVDIVQLRHKGLEARQEIEYAEVFAAAAARHGRLWSINDRADVAFVARPDVLHLGQHDLPVPAARAILGPDLLVGRSTHAPAEVEAAAVEPGVDYFCVGPTWPTPTKPGRPAPGLGLLRHAVTIAAGASAGASAGAGVGIAAAAGAARPWFAIGGIDLDNLEEVLATGATRVVVVRAITEAADPAEATRRFVARLRG